MPGLFLPKCYISFLRLVKCCKIISPHLTTQKKLSCSRYTIFRGRGRIIPSKGRCSKKKSNIILRSQFNWEKLVVDGYTCVVESTCSSGCTIKMLWSMRLIDCCNSYEIVLRIEKLLGIHVIITSFTFHFRGIGHAK